MNNFYKLINSETKKYSQNNQDLLALWLNKGKTGFFVEFGATDGISLSNTKLLEENGWDGILAEPSSVFHENLFQNRNCHIDTSCVSDSTGDTVIFYEVGGSGLSSMERYADNDHWSVARQQHIKREVTTITLKDLLDKYKAPEKIDYISIDTEGAEFDILLAYDFSRHFKVATIEHNHTGMKYQINELLNDNGYIQIFPDLSDWDNWYINLDLFKE